MLKLGMAHTGNRTHVLRDSRDLQSVTSESQVLLLTFFVKVKKPKPLTDKLKHAINKKL